MLTVRGRRLGTGTAVLPSAGRHAIRVALNRRGRAKLRRAPRIRATLTLVVTDSAGNAVTLRRRLTLVR